MRLNTEGGRIQLPAGNHIVVHDGHDFMPQSFEQHLEMFANLRLVIRHDAGSSAAPYVAGTLLAVRRVREQAGLRRGLDQLLD